MIIKKNLHLKNIKRYRVSEGRDLEKGLRLDRNEKVDNWPKDFIKTVLASKPDGFFSMYPEITPLYTKLANHLRVSEKQLLITSGIDGSIKNLFSVLLEEGDKIGVFSPTYLMYEIYSEIFKIDFFPLTYSTDYKLKQDELDKFLSLNPKILFVPNPNQPIESSLTLNELKELASKCKKKNCFLVIDEAYFMLGADTGITLLKDFNNIIILRTFSKAFGVPSIRAGFTISTEENMEVISKMRIAHELSSTSIAIAEYLLDNFSIVENYCEKLKKSRDQVLNELKNIGIEVRGKHGNYLLITFENEEIAKNVVSFLKKKLIYVKGPYKGVWKRCIGVTIGIEEKMKPFISAMKEVKKSILI
jgi:histidinol-phosphate aminotransferase